MDANSLYPGSMLRLYTVEGTPEVIKAQDYEELKNSSTAFTIEIEVTDVKKHYKFPLTSYYEKGVVHWDDKNIIGRRFVVDDITLEDLINFQQIEFKIIRGYKWTGAKDYRIQKLIRRLFNTRKKLKSEGNPLEIVYKLILNNIYGKSIQKPISKDYRIICGDEAIVRYRERNSQKLIWYQQIDSKINDPATNRYICEIEKSSEGFYNNCLFGSHVLSMSKRIMNEVMCLADDLNMYYQDTDSFFIDKDDVKTLEEKYGEKYNRELIGEDLGQFHGDFSSMDGRKDVKYASESLFIRKKLYCNKLLMEKEHINDITYRSKGINLDALESTAREKYPDLYSKEAIFQTYLDMANGESIDVDLCKNGPKSKFHTNSTITNIDSFVRCVSGPKDDIPLEIIS
jgi:hypothetical protein